VSRPFLYVWKLARAHPERVELWEAALRASGEVHVERAQRELYRKGLATPSDVALAKARSEYHRWVAGKRDDRFSEKTRLEVSGTVGMLHLQALQQRGSMSLAPTLQSLPAEIVEDDDAG
jgi:hypothetical protein